MLCKLCGKQIIGKYCIYCGKKSSTAVVGNLRPSDNSATDNLDLDIDNSGNSYTESGATQPSSSTGQKQSNGFAIAGFILSLFGEIFFIIGLIFSIIGLVKSRQMNDSGKGLAIAGIVISSLYVAFYVIYFILMMIRHMGIIYP